MKTINLLIILCFLGVLFSGCTKKETLQNEVIQNEVKGEITIDLNYPKTVENSTLGEYEVTIKNTTKNPVMIVSILSNAPKTAKFIKGTEFLTTNRHKFNKGAFIYIDKLKDAKDPEYTIPEIHKIKEVVLPNETKVFKFKAIFQSIKDKYEDRVTVEYIELTNDWINFLFVFDKEEKLENGIRNLYIKTKSIPQKFDNVLISSSSIGKSSEKSMPVSVEIKKDAETYKRIMKDERINLFVKDLTTKAFIYYDGNNSEISFIDGKNIQMENNDLFKLFIKTRFDKEIKLIVLHKIYEEIKDTISELKIDSEDSNFKKVVLPFDKAMEYLFKLEEKGYTIYRGESIVKKGTITAED